MRAPSTGAWGKKSLTNDVAERIKQQTHENIQKRLRDQKDEAERLLAAERAARASDRVKHDEELEAALKLVDTLLEFIAQHAGDIPEELINIIARRQEQRILNSAPVDVATQGTPSPPDGVKGSILAGLLPLAKDGGAPRYGWDGTFRWTAAEVLQQMLADLAK